ncbi:MAG: UDP-N-acetylglucosamine 1-carboxyvinyltransferase, partial [Cyclobacteriaceae bacterium]|nr:UDP-N-acetylglucosamine 1-carboxyvinyltransferase [Cyclobacteriaceae bacterium]
MTTFKVVGGKSLKGSITPQGAKNEALQILCATLLTSEPITIHNVPDIRDVNKLIELVSELGVKVEKLANASWKFTALEINMAFLQSEIYEQKAASLRGSIMIL